MSLCECSCPLSPWALDPLKQEIQAGDPSRRSSEAGGCALTNVTARNLIQALCKGSKHSKPLSYLSGPVNPDS